MDDGVGDDGGGFKVKCLSVVVVVFAKTPVRFSLIIISPAAVGYIQTEPAASI